MGNAQWWVCDECKSANDLSANKCYNCRAKKPARAQVIGDKAEGQVQSNRRVGITVDLESVKHLMQPDPIAESKDAADFAADFMGPGAGATSSELDPARGASGPMTAPAAPPMRPPEQRSISVLGQRPDFGSEETVPGVPSFQPERPADPAVASGPPPPPAPQAGGAALPPPAPGTPPPPPAPPPQPDQPPGQAPPSGDQRPPAAPVPPPGYVLPGQTPTYGAPPGPPPPPGQMVPPTYPPPPPSYVLQPGGSPPPDYPPQLPGSPPGAQPPPGYAPGAPPPPGMPPASPDAPVPPSGQLPPPQSQD